MPAMPSESKEAMDMKKNGSNEPIQTLNFTDRVKQSIDEMTTGSKIAVGLVMMLFALAVATVFQSKFCR